MFFDVVALSSAEAIAKVKPLTTGIQAMAITTITPVARRPMRTISLWAAFGRSFSYLSTVNSVEQALNTPANELINAESNSATTMPRSPGGNR